MTLLLAGFVPLFTSRVLISISGDWAETARYLVGFSPLSAPWQPLQWLEHSEVTKIPGRPEQAWVGPFAAFSALHVGVFVLLFFAWRRQRRLRETRA